MQHRITLAFVGLSLTLAAAGCNGDTTTAGDDAGTDGAVADGGRTDAGPHDAGSLDATSALDATASDAGHDAGVDVGIDVGIDMGNDVGTDAFDPCSGVTCTAMDGCHLAGTCSSATGTCSTPNAPDGTLCSFAPGPGVCTAGHCTESCSDAVMDGDETDVDCGGTCSPCAAGLRCRINADCTMGCIASTQRCASSQCADQQRDGTETDVDCGGNACPRCALNQHCSFDTDCLSSACDTLSFSCVANACADHHRDDVETDVDCGGTCPPCGLGLRCIRSSDCVSNACDAVSFTCDASQCNDHQRDGVETDVDCGGTDACARCAVGQRCIANGDCTSGHVCDGTTNLCQ